MKKPILNSQSWHHRAKHFVITTCLMIMLAPSATALTPDPSGGLLEAIDKLREEIVARMEASKSRLDELFLDAYDNLTSSAQLPNLATHNPANAYQFTEGGNPDQKALPVYDLVKESVQQAVAKKLQASLSPGNTDAQRQVLLQPLSTGSDAIANMLDAQSLLGPLVYDSPASQNLAERAVAFLSDYASPIGSIDLQKLHDEKPDIDKSRAGEEYKVKIFTQAAIRSLFLGTLYESLESRIPVKGLGKISGMPNKNDASLAEVMKYIASRRISDKNWYDTINKAPPVVVEREGVFILSEIQWQLYQLHRDNERILQTMTALGVLSLRAGKIMPDKNESELKMLVEGTAPTPPTTEEDNTHQIPNTDPDDLNVNSIPTIPQ